MTENNHVAWFEEESESIKVPEYIPDQELYGGMKFTSYSEMIQHCPLLEVKKNVMDLKGLAYTPYVCKFEGDDV
jgi:hypothetical protein